MSSSVSAVIQPAEFVALHLYVPSEKLLASETEYVALSDSLRDRKQRPCYQYMRHCRIFTHVSRL